MGDLQKLNVLDPSLPSSYQQPSVLRPLLPSFPRAHLRQQRSLAPPCSFKPNTSPASFKMLEHISSDFDFDLDHPLPITIPLLLISPPEPPRSPLRPASRSPVVRCSLPSPPSTPRRYPLHPPLKRSYATYRGQSFFPSSPEEEEDEEDKEWGLLDIQPLPPTPTKPSTRQDLDVNDRAQMFELMRMDCSDEHCGESNVLASLRLFVEEEAGGSARADRAFRSSVPRPPFAVLSFRGRSRRDHRASLPVELHRF